MARSAAQAKIDPKNINQFVGSKIRELRGAMLPSDFATKNGMHQAELGLYEHGERTASLQRLRFLAIKNDMRVEDFFPDGKVPERYPEF